MAHVLSAGDWIERIEHPEPSDFPSAEDWVDALLIGESARGPLHGDDPAVTYASLWALWLSAVPYGLWSEQMSIPSLEEEQQMLRGLEEAIEGALDRFGLILRHDTTVADLVLAIASLTEGVWVNQCLTRTHPSDPTQPVAELLRRSGARRPSPRGAQPRLRLDHRRRLARELPRASPLRPTTQCDPGIPTMVFSQGRATL